MTILVTGGAGYIGSITNDLLLLKGFQTIVFDNLHTGHKAAIGKSRFVQGDLTDYKGLEALFGQEKIDAVVHFAALTLPSESMEKPDDYYLNNVMGGVNLLEAMKAHKCRQIVFSSTCSVYGTPTKLPVSEAAKVQPESVYGSSKKMFEEILGWYEKLYGIKSVILRYFNASGAKLDGTLGESHNPETHIIPIALEVALGKRPEFQIYGKDYDTPDGTCIRDYIHVLDLAEAHISALSYLQNQNKSNLFNLGVGRGYSNMEVLTTVETVTGKKLNKKFTDRRPGDPAMVYADNTKAKQELGWIPKYSDLETIVKSAWKWHLTHPNGFEE